MITVQHDNSFSTNDFTITTNNNEVQLCSDNQLVSTFFPSEATKVLNVYTEYLHPKIHADPDYVTNIMFDNGETGAIYWKGQEQVYYEIVDLMGDE